MLAARHLMIDDIKLTPFARIRRGSTSKRAIEYRAFKEHVAMKWKERYPGEEPYPKDVLLKLEVDLYHPAPDQRGMRRWDLVNVVKSIEDALNGIAYVDDWQIVTHWTQIHERETEGLLISLWREAIHDREPIPTFPKTPTH